MYLENKLKVKDGLVKEKEERKLKKMGKKLKIKNV